MTQTISDALQQKLATLPTDPGVYIHKDRRGKVLYVGKAKNLRNRVRSYFQDSRHLDIKTQALVEKISDFDYIVTKSEKESLVLEMNLIKHHKPRYNIQLKDDKKYPYIKVTLNETYPRVFPTRNLVNDGAKYYGPYTSAKKMRQMLMTLKRLFPIRSCNETLPFPEDKRPCLDYYIHKCEAPCKEYVSAAEYQAMIRSVCQFIEGKSDDVLQYLKNKMAHYAAQLRFEDAARIRNQLSAITQTIEEQRINFADPFADWDAIAFATDDDDACVTIMEIRGGKILGRPHYFFRGVKNEPAELILAFGFHSHYDRATILPDDIFLQNGLEDQDELAEWLSDKKGKKVHLHVPQRGEKRQLIEMTRKNAALLLEELMLDKMKQKERVPDILREVQKRLKLSRVPRVIEGFDNSNIQGSDPVAGMVCFKNGKPYKGGYRKFKIKGVEGPDDFASMREVVTRRYQRLLEEDGELPDLILIDGGKGQLSAAVEALESLGIPDQDIIGLAKRLEEIYLPGQSEPIMIPKSSPALKLLQHVRDEVHRFAVTYHRSVRGKHITESVLDKIPGIGPTKKFALLRAFGSVEGVRQASVEAIAEVKGFSLESAKRLLEELERLGQ